MFYLKVNCKRANVIGRASINKVACCFYYHTLSSRLSFSSDKHLEGDLSYLLGVTKVILLPLRVLSLERSTLTVGTFSIPFRVLYRKIRQTILSY